MRIGPKKKVQAAWENDNRHDDRHKLAAKQHSRLDTMPGNEILNWCDTTGSGMARALSDYRRTCAPEALEEARMGAITILVALELLQDRNSTSRG